MTDMTSTTAILTRRLRTIVALLLASGSLAGSAALAADAADARPILDPCQYDNTCPKYPPPPPPR